MVPDEQELMMRAIHCTLALCAAAALAGVAQAGTVNVTFQQPTRFADAGDWRGDEDANLQELSRHFQALASRLPANQSLSVEVLDVDLAGDVRPGRVSARDFRVLRGGADWPRMTLRYRLESGGTVLKSGEESIADMDYANRFRVKGQAETLYYEKRMIDDWFRARVLPSP
jgi:hypothetical protein